MRPSSGALRYFGRIKNGTTPASGEPEYWDGDVMWATPEDLGGLTGDRISSTKRKVTDKAVQDSNLSVLPAESIIISTRAPIGHMAINDVPLAFNQGCRGIIPNNNVHGPFLYYLLMSRVPELNAIANGTTFVELSRDELAAVPVEIPPLDIQRRIARFLDEKTARIDGLIEKKRTLLDRLAEKRQVLITRAVTKGLYPDTPMRPSGIDWLGDIPAHWEILPLKRLVDDGVGLQMGPFGGMLTNLPDYETGFKLYGQENTISGDFTRGRRWIEQERFEELRRYELVPGDLVITRKGSLGSCRRVPVGIRPGIADSDTIRIRPNRLRLTPEWALTLLHEALFISEQIATERRGAILSGLNTTVVGNLLFSVPPVVEQAEILAALNEAVCPDDSIAEQVNTTINRLVEYRSAVITAAVTGQIAELR